MRKAGDPEEWWDEKVPGFGIRVSSKGKKTWMEVPGHVIALILNHKQMDITS